MSEGGEQDVARPGAQLPAVEVETPRRVTVDPEDVWQPGGRGAAPRPRWSEQSIFAPIVLVVGLSTVLLYGLLALAGLLFSLLR